MDARSGARHVWIGPCEPASQTARAERLRHGLEAGLAAAEEARAAARLLDVAICPRHPGAAPRLAALLSEFLGCDEAVIAESMERQPGWIMRHVSPAAIRRLQQQFAARDVAVRISDPATTAYDLDVSRMDRRALPVLARECARLGVCAHLRQPVGGAVAAHLLQRFERHGLAVIDRAFLPHCVLLTRLPAHRHGMGALAALAGLAPQDMPSSPKDLPLVLDHGLDRNEAREAMVAYTAAGLATVALSRRELPRWLEACFCPGPGSGRRREDLLQQVDEGTQPVRQRSRPGIDQAHLHRQAAPLGEMADKPSCGNVIRHEIFRKKRQSRA